MYTITLPDTLLTANDISSILNYLPSCGGPLGEPSKEFKCQGLCRKDWRPDLENRRLNRKPRKTTGGTNQRRISPATASWRIPF